MSTRSLWQLGCLAGCIAAAPISACGTTTSNGNTPPVNGGGDDASPDRGVNPTPDGSGSDGAGPDVTPSNDGGSPGDGTPSPDGPAGHDGAPDAVSSEGGGIDGTAADGGTDAVLSSDVTPPPPVLCTPGETWGSPVTVLTTGSADSTIFGAVTPDELTIAWASSSAGVVTAWYADRASTSVPFGTPQALASSFGALLLDRVSLSGDGLRIVGVAGSGKGFVAAKRAARTGPFDTDDGAEFSGVGHEGSPSTYATPLLSSDNSSFLYIVTSSTSDFVVNQSLGGPPWLPGAPLSPTELERVGTQYRRPSGLSMDDRTLFYWDETTSSEWVAYSATAGGDFNVFDDIGALTNAVPTASCTRIYYSVPAASGAITIVYADGTPPDF